jgi:hypothetical protein
MAYGHDPRDVREWAYGDLELLVIYHHEVTTHG